MSSEDLQDFYEQLNEATSDKQVVMNVTLYIIMITTIPCMSILTIIMLAPTLIIAVIGSLIAIIVWVLGYHTYHRSIMKAVAAKTFIFSDTNIGNRFYEEQICVTGHEDIVVPEKPIDISELQYDIIDVEETLDMIRARKVGDVHDEGEEPE